MPDTGNRIKRLRKAAGLSQEKLSKITGTARSTVAMWEAGTRIPRSSELAIMSEIFDVSIDYLICSTNKRHKNGILDRTIDLSRLNKHGAEFILEVYDYMLMQPKYTDKDYNIDAKE